MRTPSFEVSPGALAELLNDRRPIGRVDLWTVTLTNGLTFRWASGDRPVTMGPNMFDLGPGITRSNCKWMTGISVDSMTMSLTDIVGTTINGTPLQAFIAARGFDDAVIKLERAFWDMPAPETIVGAFIWFLGVVDDVDGNRHEASIRIVSMTKTLNQLVPRDLYQSSCRNVVYDPSTCKLVRSAWQVTGAAEGPTNSYRTSFSHSLPQASGYFALGSITMTSGLNSGISRTVRAHSTTTLTVLQPWPFHVADGDTFQIVPGCDNTVATCTNKFNNRPRFRAEPFIPIAETVT